MNNDDSSVRTTSSTNNNVVQKRGTWTRYNGGIHCYTNNRLITMFERIGFQRFFAEIPGHEVFGVLEADFLPVKAAWIEYERRSVLFQLVMKAMRMAVHKYYYEIQTTYVLSLSFCFVHTHTHTSYVTGTHPHSRQNFEISNQEARKRMSRSISKFHKTSILS